MCDVHTLNNKEDTHVTRHRDHARVGVGGSIKHKYTCRVSLCWCHSEVLYRYIEMVSHRYR